MAFDLRMRALHCAEQSGNSTSNSEQAIQFIPTPCTDSERHLFRRRKMKMEMKPMKKLILSAALAAMLTSPAFAQSDSDRATVLERLGGRVIALPPSEWNAILEGLPEAPPVTLRRAAS